MTARLWCVLLLLLLAGVTSRPEAHDRYHELSNQIFQARDFGQKHRIIQPDEQGVLRIYEPIVKRSATGGLILQGTERSVCDAGCTYTVSTTNLTTAINASAAGDGIKLQRAARFVMSAVLRASAGVIDIRTAVEADGSDIPESDFPVEGLRIAHNPTVAAQWGGEGTCGGQDCEDVLATIQAPSANQSAMRTVEPGNTGARCASAPCISHGWRIRRIQFMSDPSLYSGGSLVELGSSRHAAGLWDGGTDVQNKISEVPTGISFEQNLVTGNPVVGQHRGLAISCSDCTVKDSTFRYIKGVQHDGQSILVQNTPGDITILNNGTDGGTEHIMVNGDASRMRRTTTVAASPAPTTSVFTVTAPADGYDFDEGVDQWISLGSTDLVEGGATGLAVLVRRAGDVFTVQAQTPLTAPPAAATSVLWTMHTRDVRILRNHLKNDLTTRGPITAAPTGVAEAEVAGGTLTDGQAYTYRVYSRRLANQGTMALSPSSAIVTCNPTGANLSCRITWNPVTNVTAEFSGEYRIYRNGVTRFTVAAGVTTFTDTGAAGTAETAPTGTGTIWSKKNILEFKHAYDSLAEGNHLENIWESGQQGYCMLLSTLPGEGGDESGVVTGVTVRYNRCRGMAGAFGLNAMSTNQAYKSGTSQRLHMHDNIFEDMGSFWRTSGSLYAIAIGGGEHNGILMWHPEDFQIYHNTFVATTTMDGSLRFSMYLNGAQRTVVGMVYRDNISPKGTQGLRAFTPNFTNEGTASWGASTSSAGSLVSSCAQNIFIGVNTTLYPAGCAINVANEAAFQALFVNYADGNFRCASGAACDGTATDGGDLGADIDTIDALTAIALSGNNTGAAVTIDTPSPLLNATTGVTYLAVLVCSGGLEPYTFVRESGVETLPTGLAVSAAGTISGTPAPGTAAVYSPVVRCTDSVGITTTKLLQLTVTAGPEAAFFYNWAKGALLDASLNLPARAVTVMLANATYVPDPDHEFIDEGGASDAVDARIAGSTDQLLTGKTFGTETIADYGYMLADAVTFSATTGQTATSLIFYDNTGTTTTSRLIGWAEVEYVLDGSAVTVTWTAANPVFALRQRTLTAFFYNWAKQALLEDTLDLSTRDLRVILARSLYVPDPDHTLIDAGGAADLVDARAAGSSDQVLATIVTGVDTTWDLAYLDAGNVSFVGVTGGQTIGGLGVYDFGTGQPVGYVTLPYVTTGATINIQWPVTTAGAILSIR